jgi:AraC-like DNA-binding protein
VAYGTGIETVLSEARKFGVSVVSANQFLDQYPAEIRAAILSVGTHAFFQLSSVDAGQVAQALDGGKPLAERLKNLSQRHCIVKMSTRSLQRNIQANSMTFRELLEGVRRERAPALLQDSRLSVKEVAARLQLSGIGRFPTPSADGPAFLPPHTERNWKTKEFSIPLRTVARSSYSLAADDNPTFENWYAP